MSVFGYNSELRETHIQTNPVCKVSLRRVFYILKFPLIDINSQRPSGHQYCTADANASRDLSSR